MPSPWGATPPQINWQTITLEIASSATGGASYPILYPAVNGSGSPATAYADSFFNFQVDALLLGVFFSTTWVTAAAAEGACIALSQSGKPAIRATGSNSCFFQHALFCTAAMTASVPIQRNPGAMFPPPLLRFIPANTGVQLYATRQTSMSWRTICEVYYITVPDFLAALNRPNIGLM